MLKPAHFLFLSNPTVMLQFHKLKLSKNTMSTEILLTIKLNQALFADPKRIALLNEIKQCGSINQAAKNCQISYKSAWDHLSLMNEISPKPLFERTAGGKNGGGTVLTRYAERLLQLYALLEETQQRAFDILQDEHIPLDNSLFATAKFALKSSARNQFFGTVETLYSQENKCNVLVKLAAFPQYLTACITVQSAERLALERGKPVMLMIKAPWLKLHSKQPKGENVFQAKVISVVDKEKNQDITLDWAGITCFASESREQLWQQGQEVWITIDPEQIVLLTI